LLLFPVLIAVAVVRRAWLCLMAGGFVSAVSACFCVYFYGQNSDPELLVWVILGTAVFWFAVVSGYEARAMSGESLFLLVWFITPFLFSVFMVPFQAVRHLLPALPPLTLLLFRYLDGIEARSRRGPSCILTGALLVQLSLAFFVQIADYEYAATYRKFADHAQEKWISEDWTTWYVGHWGWKYYADRAGFHQIHRDGPMPQVGDCILWPQRVHIGDVYSRKKELVDNLELVESIPYTGWIPIRTMTVPDKAGFYASIRGRLPFRLGVSGPLEIMNVYRVQSE
jgi:hypothetical protein